MWDKFKKILGYIWASPVTFVGLTYSGLFRLAGWYKWIGRKEDALAFRVNQDAPTWLTKLWKKWSGHAVGNVIVLNVDPDSKPTVLQHELVHVRQCMRLGIFQPIIYGISYLGIKFGCESSDPYFSNPFEIDARRSVGQVVDVEGVLKRLKDDSIRSSSDDKNQGDNS